MKTQAEDGVDVGQVPKKRKSSNKGKEKETQADKKEKPKKKNKQRVREGEGVPLVMIHGFKGSHLKDSQTGRRAYVTRTGAAGLLTPSLALPMNWNFKKTKGKGKQKSEVAQEKDTLLPDGPIPSVLGVKVYSPFLKLAKASGRPFYPFAYDWRRDNNENSVLFERFLESVEEKERLKILDPIEQTTQSKKLSERDLQRRKEQRDQLNIHGRVKIQIVAHSNGGLLTLSVLNRRPDLIHSVLFAGVPFGGGIGFMPDLHVGTPLGLNKKLLKPEVLFTFPTSFTFFSLDPNDSGLFESDGTPIKADLYSIKEWKKHKLSLYSHENETKDEQNQNVENQDDTKCKLTPQHKTHLKYALRQARRFKESLAARSDITYPPIGVIVGEGIPTLNKMLKDGPKSVRGWDFVTADRGDGDSRVTVEKAVPEGVPHVVFRSKFEHSELLNDLELVKKVLAFLLGGAEANSSGQGSE
jgi:hypothetical protein